MLFGATILACLSLAHALPALSDEGMDLISMSLREVPADDKFRDKLPGCGDDPSFATTKSVYKINQGVKVPRVDKKDATEYWIVESEVEYNDWVNTGSAIDCKSTSRCTSTDTDLGQTCETITATHSDGGEFKYLDVAIDGKIFKDYGLKYGASLSYKWDNSKGTSQSVCTSQSARNQCSWEDDKCHQVWYAQRDVRLYGYAMRVCNGKDTSKPQNVQLNVQRDSDKKWIRGQQDFSIRLPINKLVGCNALCEATSYNEPIPEEKGRHPFTADWEEE
ncbi:hypothetical protein F4821DRAFT_281790 [Hypoxylon rubiginosum]|uniref:Uncharacterized protein n=1 Tax=Hypoxylon rubiginosum TaxID=110542 RepID=A0ACC0CQ37_9PEZI|nr:hypothetical protein F4821DRAFT_281790 [Hypoxylon rubiginosum]